MRLVRRDVTRYLAGNDHITYGLRRHAYLYTDRYSGAESCILCSSSGRCVGFTWSKFTLIYVYGRKKEIFNIYAYGRKKEIFNIYVYGRKKEIFKQ
jgi:hypothetical protein